MTLLIAAALAQDCENTALLQDLNCNGIDAYDELRLFDDPSCDHPSTDWYYDYTSFGCTLDMSALDTDGDGFVTSDFQVLDEDSLGDACDICPWDDNPDQVDTDQDGLGDACNACNTTSTWIDVDQDGVPDDCDNCLDRVNPMQADDDGDGMGNGCDPDPTFYGAGSRRQNNCSMVAAPAAFWPLALLLLRRRR
ncbi:MAG: hypothetical protein GY913_34400 [Proteobacteria bacterium]|nr:hypothetical protein [Pseudomonadota bacterium]MCP4922021.1 hypothetical protein [Pseudomonadota bacterium]